MTSNVRDPPFGDPVQPDKVLSSAHELLPNSVRNPTSPIVHVGMSATSPSTPTNWSGAQQRPPHGVTSQFDFNSQTARTRFRDPVNSVPGAFPADTYANNGQASFAGGAMSYGNAPRSAHRGQRGGPFNAQSTQERGPYKSGHVTSTTYDSSATPLGSANANANVSGRGTGRGALVKSSTVDSHMAVPYNVTPAASGDGNDSAAFYNAHPGRDRQFMPGRNGNGSGNGRPNTNANNWGNANWANQNNSTAQGWTGQGQNWMPGQNSPAPAWTNQSGAAGGPSAHANWAPYGQGHAHGQSHRGSSRGSRTSRGAIIAVAAQGSTAQSTALAVGPGAVAGPSAAADVTGSPSPSGSTSTDGVSSACATDSAPERVSATEPGTDAATRRRSTPPPSATTGTARRSTSSASASPTSAAAGSAPPPDSALGTPQQTENWQSASSSPASASGVATPTRTTNKFGLTFGEFDAEIDNIVNPNRTAPSPGVSISMNASAPLQPPAPTPVHTQTPAPPITDAAELARPQVPATGVAAEPPAASEPRTAAPAHAKQKLDTVPTERQSVSEASGASTAPPAAASPSPLTLQLVFELQRSFDDVQNKAIKGSKRVVRYSAANTCFHQHAAPTVAGSGASMTETHSDNASASASSSVAAPTNCASPALPKS